MLVFSHSRISTRLFVQAALTALLAPGAAHGRGWLMVTLVVAAAAVGVALVVRTSPPNMRPLVVGFEAAALGVGLVGMAEGHYIPGTIIGVVTLITVLSGQQQQPAPAGGWTPPAPYGAAPGYPPPPPGSAPPPQGYAPPPQGYAPPPQGYAPPPPAGWGPPAPDGAAPGYPPPAGWAPPSQGHEPAPPPAGWAPPSQGDEPAPPAGWVPSVGDPYAPPQFAVPAPPVVPAQPAVPDDVPAPSAPTAQPSAGELPPVPRSMNILPGQ